VVLKKEKYLTFGFLHTFSVFDDEVRLYRNHPVVGRIITKYGS
jgi:hypothetical protein